MSMQDPVSDALTRIRNAQRAEHREVVMPASRMRAELARVLKEEGYIEDYSVGAAATGGQQVLSIRLKYYRGKPVIAHLQRVSRPGLRVYRGKSELPRVQGGYGVAIVSTSRGLMTDRAARAAGQGGEVICEVS